MIRRGKHRADYTILPNLIFEHPDLSAAAKGTLCYLLSRPPGWETRHQHLRHVMRLGRDAFKKVMAEIIGAGFAWRSDEQQRDGDNAFLGYDYVIYDAPQRVEISTPVVGFPTAAPRCRESDSGSKEGDNKNLDSNLSQERDFEILSESVIECGPEFAKLGSPTAPNSKTGTPSEPVKPAGQEGLPTGVQNTPVKRADAEHLIGSEKVPIKDSVAEPPSTASLAEFQAAWGASAIDSVHRTMRAWGALTIEQRQAALAGIRPFKAELERAKRTHSIAGWRYLEERRWELLTVSQGEWVDVKPLSRDWWALLFAKIERGEPVASFAECTLGSTRAAPFKRDAMPTFEQIARLEAYASDSDAMKAWHPWLAARRVRVPRLDTAWVFLPSAAPPPDANGGYHAR